MKPLAPLSLLLLPLAACAALDSDAGLESAPVLLESEGVVVRCNLWRQAGRLRMSGALATSEAPMHGVFVHAFEDLDGDGQLDPEEKRGSWTIEASPPSRRLRSAATVELEPKDPADLASYLVSTTVYLEGGRVVEAVCPFPPDRG